MHGCDAEFALNGCLLKLKNLFQWPRDMVRREAGWARAPGPEPPARAPEPASGQAWLPRAARADRIDFGEQSRRASERAAAKIGERTVARHIHVPVLVRANTTTVQYRYT